MLLKEGVLCFYFLFIATQGGGAWGKSVENTEVSISYFIRDPVHLVEGGD